MRLAAILLVAAVASGVPKQRRSYNLLTLDTSVDTSTFPACEADEIISCVAATVNWDSLKNPEEDTIILPTGDELFESSYIQKYGFEHHDALGDTPLSFQYKNKDGAEAVLTYRGNSLYGDLDLGKSGDFIIEQYNEEYVLWIEVDQQKFEDGDGEPIEPPSARALPHMAMDELVAQGREDRDTMVVYSVTVYYTAEFKRVTYDVATWVDQVIAETNAGYANTEIPIRIKLHCLIESTIPDGQGSSFTLRQFAYTHGSDYNKLRRSADVTVLLTKTFRKNDGACGVNYFDQISTGFTIGTVTKGCGMGYYSFGHEIGHGLGLTHDRRVSAPGTGSTPYSFGYIIYQGWYRTIMAYNDQGETRVNYYSSPNVWYKKNILAGSYVTGDGENDNARVLRENRFAAANIGNEQGRC